METRLLISGEQVPGDGSELAVENPATEETLTTLCGASPEQVDAAVAGAREAARGWADTPAVERAEMLHEVANRMRAITDDLARALTSEGGKPLIENRDEVGWTAAAFDYYAEMGRNFAGRVIPSIEATRWRWSQGATGVWGCIVPWNYPLLLLSWKLAPALAAGNAVVAKPSEVTPAFDPHARRVLLRPGPRGGQSRGRRGGRWSGHRRGERIDGVAFTGSVATGKKVAVACAQRVGRMNLEMGGKDPFIVCADVADDVAVAAGRSLGRLPQRRPGMHLGGAFLRAARGLRRLLGGLRRPARALRVGDPLDETTDVGPMVSAPQRAKVEAQVEAAVAAGAEVVVGGDRAGQERGHYFAPTVVTGAPAETDLLRRGDLWPGGADRACWIARRGHRAGQLDPLRAGRERLHARPRNGGALPARDPRRNSLDQRPAHRQRRRAVRRVQAVGHGRELGQEGLEAFQETKHVHIETKIAPKEWWYPYAPGS